jgi:sulfur carrier protein ThiS
MDRRKFIRPLVAAFACAAGLVATPRAASAPPDPRVGKSHAHANLAVFFLHGPSATSSHKVIPLKEAIDQKVVVVAETSAVNCLTIINTSPDMTVFVMAGDVVKGGKQDRAIAFDLLLPPKSGDVPLPSFCVEQGRWNQRGGELDSKFAASDVQICNRALKLAVNDSRQQGEVWKEVAAAQKKISDNVGKPVQSAASPTSLQLALEDKDLQAKLSAYESAFPPSLIGDDVIGVAVAINGQVVGADVFASHDLFRQMWPKILKSAATEALSEFNKDKPTPAAKSEDVEALLRNFDATKPTVVATAPSVNRQVRNPIRNAAAQAAANAPAQQPQQPPPAANEQPATGDSYPMRIVQYSGPKSLVIESRDKSASGLVWHRSYIVRN